MDSAPKKYTVLLLSAPIGSGHMLAAEALAEVLRGQADVKVVQGNVFDFFPKAVGALLVKSYFFILGTFPCLYRLIYSGSNAAGGSVLWLRSLINGALALAGHKYFAAVKPDAVICTHATPAGIAAIYKKRRGAHFFLGAAVTDYTVHGWWLYEGVDSYFTACEEIAPRIGAASVLATGIPVRRAFTHLHRQECRRQLGWPEDKKICLLMGGGAGLLPMEGILDAFQGSFPDNLRLVAVTGHNDALRRRLQQRFGKLLEVHGFTDAVPQMLCAADILLSKAGGLTMAEALAAGTEILIYRPLPGQEAINAAFLERHGAAVTVEDFAAAVQRIRDACQQPPGAGARHFLARPEAAVSICKYLLGQLRPN